MGPPSELAVSHGVQGSNVCTCFIIRVMMASLRFQQQADTFCGSAVWHQGRPFIEQQIHDRRGQGEVEVTAQICCHCWTG